MMRRGDSEEPNVKFIIQFHTQFIIISVHTETLFRTFIREKRMIGTSLAVEPFFMWRRTKLVLIEFTLV